MNRSTLSLIGKSMIRQGRLICNILKNCNGKLYIHRKRQNQNFRVEMYRQFGSYFSKSDLNIIAKAFEVRFA